VRHNRRLRWAAIPIAAALVVALAGCTQAQLHGFLPGFVEGEPPVTNHTERISGLWVTSWIVLLIVGIVVWGLILWAVIVYRRRKGQTGLPVQLRYNMPIEIFYTIVPLILVLGFFAFTARDQTAIEEPLPDPDVTIEVFGKRWSWDFNYVNENVFSAGVQAESLADGTLDAENLPQLYLPVGAKVEVKIESRDVIHSFWIVPFLMKQDVIPGHTNVFQVTPSKEGTFLGKCAELCGVDHSRMLFNVKVVSPQAYRQHLKDLAAAGQTGYIPSGIATTGNAKNSEPKTT
jgi:cytochrome c oxidase subunit 2